MKGNTPNKRTPIQQAALAVVRSEMRLYDAMSSVPRIRVDRSNIHTLDSIVDLQHGTRSCAHGRALHDVCSECERNEDDCKAYRVAASQRIKDLLKQLE
jgi:hypothetical protein